MQALKTKSKLERKSLSDSSEESDTDNEEEIVVNPLWRVRADRHTCAVRHTKNNGKLF